MCCKQAEDEEMVDEQVAKEPSHTVTAAAEPKARDTTPKSATKKVIRKPVGVIYKLYVTQLSVGNNVSQSVYKIWKLYRVAHKKRPKICVTIMVRILHVAKFPLAHL